MGGLDIVHYSITPYKILSLDSEAWLLAFCGDHGNNKKIACGGGIGGLVGVNYKIFMLY